MTIIQQTMVTISYTCTDGETWPTPGEAQEHQRLLNIAGVLKAHGIVSKQMEDICKAICDGWPGLEEAMRPVAIIHTPAPVVASEPVPMQCLALYPNQPGCQCAACEFNRSIGQ